MFCSCNTNINKEIEFSKIIKTRTFGTKQNFEKIVPDKPETFLGYDQTLKIDMEWANKYYDKYGNILKLERIIARNGEIFSTIIYKYYDAVKGKIKEINYGSSKEEYNYNSNGKLLEIQTIDKNNEITDKIIFTYDNENGNLIKKKYYEIDKIKRQILFSFDENSKIYLEKDINLDRNYRTEKSLKKDNLGNTNYEKVEIFENRENNKLSSIEYHLSNFLDSIPQKIRCKGFDTRITIDTNTGVETKEKYEVEEFVIEKKFNSRNDIIEYSNKSVSPKNNVWFDLARRNEKYTVNYTYNDKNDWIELLLDVGSDKYICQREIKYFK